MKLPQVKWTQRNCIMCALVIIAILLTMYLFRHYKVIEGFDFSTSAITSSASSLTSSMPSMPSLSSSDWGAIGPLPADNVVLPETITKLKQIYTDNKLQTFMFNPDDASKYVTEAEAQDFIKNLKWTWSDKILTCIKEAGKQGLIDAASKAGKPAPTDEDIAKMTTQVDDMPKSIPIRLYIPFFFVVAGSSPCIRDLKETIFFTQLTSLLRRTPGQTERETIEKAYKVDDNKYLACKDNHPVTFSWNSVTSKAESTPTKYSEFPTLVKGFQFITPVADFDICDIRENQKSAYSLDGSVSPFYSAYWGVPASSSSSISSITNSTPAPVSSSSDDPTAVLKQIKTQLNSMTLN